DAGTASAIFGQVLQHEPQNAAAIAGLTRCYLAAGDTGRARQTLERTSAERVGDKAIAAARAALELAEQAAGTADAAPELRQRLERKGDDHAARFDLAMALDGAGERDAAVDELLELMRRDRAWNDEAARKQLVKLFEAFGPADPLTVSARRRLSSLLFA
ncbi:MAG: tetratricopeptide repeat protein, partial [Dongiaceae bacterium]